MKGLLKVISLMLVGTVSLPTSYTVGEAVVSSVKTQFVYLFAGLDDAASNTDALILASYDTADNKATVLQLPRDTYCSYGGTQNKINGIYASYIAAGSSPERAMSKTKRFIAQQLGIHIDGYVALTTEGLSSFVDSIGGVRVVLPEDFTYNGENPFTLKKGENLLSGKQAEIFVRHRSSYAMGDLGRMDAQKIFINGLYNTVTKRADYDRLLKSLSTLRRGVITDVSVADIVIMLLKHSSKFRDADITYLTMPGEAVCDSDGIWYYILNKDASGSVLRKYLYSRGEFDSRHLFSDGNNESFEKIYKKSGVLWQEYAADELSGINIIKRKQ